jgi:dTDP-4-amino-4,6-dideoxygalactose transaminase
LIEDAAHCIEGARDGIQPGQLGDTACFSFYATKNMTCGEGGAVVTNDPFLAEQFRLLRQHGMNKTAADRHREGYAHWDMVRHGWKYNMDNLQAAMLLPQLDRLEENGRRREALTKRYRAKLQSMDEATLPVTRPNSRHANHLFTVWVDERDDVIAGLQRRHIGVVVNYRAIHLLSYFREQFHFRPGQFPNAERIGDRTLSLPLYPTMPPGHVDHTVTMLAESLAQECLLV